MSPWVKFLIAVLVGLAAGLTYGWVISPVQYTNTSPNTLRADYKTDYVLMTAEIFHTDQDLTAAARRLGMLGSDPPFEIATRALQYALQSGFSTSDLEFLRDLSVSLQTWQPPGGAEP